MSADRPRRHDLTRAVVLAAGRGTRMQAAAACADITAAQADAAERGLKGLIPFHGEPFLAHVLTTLAAAGFTDACLVVRPGADPVRAHFESRPPRRLRMHFSVQSEPRGSADALLAAEAFAEGTDIAVINSDNLYPREALAGLRTLEGAGLIGFTRDGLLAGNIDAARLSSFAILRTDGRNRLTDIIEKPDAAQLADGGDLISMTCWRFRATIFDVIRATPLSPRGEYEIPDAVRIALRDEPFDVLPLSAPVLDLSHRTDIATVEAALAGRAVDP